MQSWAHRSGAMRSGRQSSSKNQWSSTNISNWIESNVWCPRAAAPMILSGVAFQRNGFRSVFWSATYRLMAGLQIDDADEANAFEASFGQRGEEALNRVQP